MPVVTGANLVGQTLSATNGAWSGQPTSYDVWWMRCAPTGNPCQNIPNSFGSTYTITSADAGHAIEVGVVATNDAGSSFTAASAPTETISSTPTTRFDLRGIMPAAVLAHWDGATSGESSGLWSEIRDPFMSLVGIADGNGAWNLILTPGCPESLGPMLPCGATNITGM